MRVLLKIVYYLIRILMISWEATPPRNALIVWTFESEKRIISFTNLSLIFWSGVILEA